MFRSLVRRRRYSRFGVTVVAGLVLGLLAAGLTYAGLRGERIRQYQVDIAVLTDGSTLVRETIDYDFGANRRHGIRHRIPLPAGASDAVEDVRASSATAPDEVRVHKKRRAVLLQVGDESSTVTGVHRYVLDYHLNLSVVSDDHVRITPIVGTWDTPIESAEIRVTAPFVLDDAACRTVDRGLPCEHLSVRGPRLVANAVDLSPHQGVRLDATSGEAVDPPATLPRDVDLNGVADSFWWWWRIGLVIVVGGLAYLAGALLVTWWIRRVGRDRTRPGVGAPVAAADGARVSVVDDLDADRRVVVHAVPPTELTPAQGGVLLTERVTDDHCFAWLLHQAVEGWCRFTSDGSMVRSGELEEWKRGAPAPLRTMFGGRRTVPLGSPDADFGAGWRRVRDELLDWREHSGLWDVAAERRSERTVATLMRLGVGALVVGGIVLYAAAMSPLWLLVSIAAAVAGIGGAGVAALVNRGEILVRTPDGFDKRQRVEGFRRFLRQPEARYVSDAVRRGTLRRYTVWAVSLGELRGWVAAVEASGAPSEAVSDVRSCQQLYRCVLATVDKPPSARTMSGQRPPEDPMSVARQGHLHTSLLGSGVAGGGVGAGGVGGGGGGSW